MAKSDVIGDFLTRLRNAAAARQAEFEADGSKLIHGIARIFAKRGYIQGVEVVREKPQLRLKISLAYDGKSKRPPFDSIERVSKPSRRVYVPAREIPRVLNGIGCAILSTSKGLMTDDEARAAHVGGEILCKVY